MARAALDDLGRNRNAGILAGLIHGASAGAAGTTALNAATYVDMTIRGRGISSAPEDLVKKTAAKAGVPIPGSGEQRNNRLAGLGPLSGIAVGTTVGAVAGTIHRVLANRGRTVPAPLAAVLIGATAMALSDVPLKLMAISDPSDWAATDWAADAVPHLVYGVVTHAAIRAADPR